MAANVLTNTKADLIAALVQRELLERASLVPFVSNFSSLAVKGAREIRIPKLSSFTVQSRAFGAAASENAALTDSVDVIPLNQNNIVLFGYDSHDEQQSSIDYMTAAIQRASAAHGREINSDILATWTASAGLNLNAGTPADITTDDILDMREFLIKNFADMTKSYLVIAADQEKAMLKLPEFSRYDYRGGNASPIVNGQIGFVYGVPVVINQQVATQQAFMVNVEGSAIAFQKAPMVAEETELTYGTGGRRVAVDVLYGTGALQRGVAGVGPTASPLIAKLRN